MVRLQFGSSRECGVIPLGPLLSGTLSIMVIIIGIGIGNQGSNPGEKLFAFHFILTFGKSMNPFGFFLYPVMSK